jgi:hypothetical protein
MSRNDVAVYLALLSAVYDVFRLQITLPPLAEEFLSLQK